MVTELSLDDAADYRFDNLYRVNWIEKLPDYQYQCLHLPFYQICDTFAIKRQRYPAGKNRNSAFCRRHPQTKPFRQNKRPDCCTERFFCYLCLDDSPACGLFALLHVKTATFKCRGEGARMLRELSAHGPQREVLTCLLSKLRVTGVGSLYLYSAWVVADLHVSMGILGPAPFFFESAGPAIRTGG
ncbi:hypothetical protein [Alistipes shahii]|uniref:hypothetical protein n=1 Tax=Alistipes shahii TaxID=328814 RepID=UPI00266C57D7|nr:hypothetical protein [Alistipes shahii]